MNVTKKWIGCVLRTGGEYVWEDVMLLRNACVANTTMPFGFFCLTDLVTETQQIDGITCVPFKFNWPGWWGKIELFRPGLWRYRPCIYFDLDVTVVGDLAPWLRRCNEGGFGMVMDFHHRRPGSTPMFIPLAKNVNLRYVWDAFTRDPEGNMRTWRREGDQGFIASVRQPDWYVQDRFPGEITNFKQARDPSTWLKDIPEDIRVIGWHGHPRPREAAQMPDFPWVKRYMELYDTPTQETDQQTASVFDVKRAPVDGVVPRDSYLQSSTACDIRESGTLLVLGSAAGNLAQLNEARRKRPGAKIMTIGHAADLTKADFIVTDHYEVMPQLRKLQDKYHQNYSAHCTRCVRWWSKVAIDYWWDWNRATASTVQTAIRIGLALGFDEIILCGCPRR